MKDASKLSNSYAYLLMLEHFSTVHFVLRRHVLKFSAKIMEKKITALDGRFKQNLWCPLDASRLENFIKPLATLFCKRKYMFGIKYMPT
jgi:hypothetical protein